MSKTINNAKRGITFKQGLQLFFVRKILDDRYTMGSLVGSERGNEFFGQWSGVVCEGRKKDKDFPCSIKVPQDYYKQFTEAQQDRSEGSLEYVTEKMRRKKIELEKPSFAPPEYHQLLQNPRFSVLLNLLGDEDLGELMRIEYPTEAEVTEIAAVVGKSKDADIIHEAIARRRGKKPEELTEDDYSDVKWLNLKETEISDLEPIKELSNLESLDLSGTAANDLRPLEVLTNLHTIKLSNTKIKDLEPLRKLTKLKRLNIAETKVDNLSPLARLENLTLLGLADTKVSNLQPVRNHKKLSWLDIRDTEVTDIEPISGLSNLRSLFISGSKISNLEPLDSLDGLFDIIVSAGQFKDLALSTRLPALRNLALVGPEVNDLTDIQEELRNIQVLELNNTNVTDLQPLKALTNLSELHLYGTQVSDEQVKEVQKALPEIGIFR